MRARRCETFLIERAPRTLQVEILVRRRGGVWRASSLARNSKCAIHNKFVLLLLFVSWLGQLFVSAFPITWIPVSVGVIRKRRTIPERAAETQFLLWTFLLVCALSHRMPMPKISAQRALFTPDQWLLVAPTNAMATETRSMSLWSIFYQSPKVVLACFSTAAWRLICALLSLLLVYIIVGLKENSWLHSCCYELGNLTRAVPSFGFVSF